MIRTNFALYSALLACAALGGCTVITAAVTDDPIRCGGRPDGTICGNELDDGIDRVCVADACVEKGCGDGYVDEFDGEECDDGNGDPQDGCEPATCLFSCHADTDCDDAQICTGTETCGTTSHQCEQGTAVACSPGDACHTSECQEEAGGTCVETLIDADMDGYAASSLGACGTDCDDSTALRTPAPGTQEVCGDGLDNDCNGGTSDATQTTWYADCDKDGYAVTAANTVVACMKPANDTSQTGCPSNIGGWTSRNPGTDVTQRDCYDLVALANPGITAWHTDVIPGTSSYNWNCIDGTEYRYPSGTLTCKASIFCLKGQCCYSSTSYSGWYDGTAPYCNVAETMKVCGTSPPCAADTSVTQSCH